jgi:hypothetical protein
MLCLKCYKVHIYLVRPALQVDVNHGWRLDVIMVIVTIARSFMSSLIIFGYCVVNLAGFVFGYSGLSKIYLFFL